MNEPEYRKVYVDVTVLMRKDGTLLPMGGWREISD